MDTIDLLLEIAETSGIYSESEFKTGVLAKKLKVSQQTISNELRRLETEGLITRKPFYLGINVSISEKGRKFLEKYRTDLKKHSKTLQKSQE